MKKFLLLIVLCVMALPSFARSGEITEVPMQQTSGDDRTEFGPPVVTYSSDDDELTISFEADDLYILEIKDAAGVTVERTDNSITLSGIDVDSIIVACYSNSGIVKKKIATSSVVTFNNTYPNSTIMLYKHNYIPYIVPMMLQNITLNRSQYVIASDVTAGKSIDSDRTQGNVTIPAGVEYEIEASGVVRLEDGFKVEKGATFAVYPSSF